MAVLKFVGYCVDLPFCEEGYVGDRLGAHGVVVDDDGLLAPFLDGRAYDLRRVFRPPGRQVGESIVQGQLWKCHLTNPR